MAASARTRRSMVAVGCTLALAALVIPATSAQAATQGWTGASDGLWSTSANWSAGPVAPNDDLLFPVGPTQKAVTNDTPAGTSYRSLSIGDSGYSLAGNAMQLTDGIATTHTSGTSTSTIPTTMTGALGAITVATGGTFVQSGAISGAQGITVSGGGTLELDSTTSNYTGDTRVNGGVLQANGTVPTTVVLGGGTLSGSGTLAGPGILATAPSTIDPGTVGGPGILTYSSASGLALPYDATLHVDLAGSTVGTGYDRLQLTNNALFNPNGATLDIELDYLPAVNTSFQIVSQTAGSPITGRFNGISQFGSVVSGPVTFSVGYFNSGVILTVTSVNVSTSTWDGGGATANWSDAANWVGDTVPTRFARLVFPAGAAQLSNVNDLAAGFDVTALSIEGAGYQLTGSSSLDLRGDVTTTYTSGTSAISIPLTLTATRTFDIASGATLGVNGAVAGSGFGVTKASGGTVLFGTSATSTFTGTTTVNAGVLRVDGSIGSSSAVSVAAGSTLSGSGTVPPVTALSGGRVAPTLLSSGGLGLTSGSEFSVALNGTTAGSGYSQASVTGSADVSGSTLAISLAFTPTYGTPFTIIANDGSDAVAGTFSGLAEGDTFTSGSILLSISYVGGDGNDVVLMVDQYAPIAGADSYVATKNAPLVVSAPGVLANDSDTESDPLTASVVTGPSNGTLTLNANGSFVYTPNANYFGADSFSYRAFDGIAYSTSISVAINVNDVPVSAAGVGGLATTGNESLVLLVTAAGALAIGIAMAVLRRRRLA